MDSAGAIRFTTIAYERFLADIETLAAALGADAWQPDYIVGIGRGGLVPGCFLSHRTGIPLLSVDHSSKVHDFAEALLTRLAAHSARGERYLFVDDINDTGKTIAHMQDAIRERDGDPANVRFAVLIDNAVSVARVDYSARRIDRTVDKDWFVFPWESVAPAAVLDEEAREDPDRLSLGNDG
jgi:hypoxanthine phosphoribosyltransferase